MVEFPAKKQNKTKQKNPAMSVIAKSVIGLLLRKITVIMAVVDTSSPGKKISAMNIFLIATS